MKNVLITGANGKVGARLVKAYLERPGYTVYALVRGQSPAHAQARMRETLAFWDIPPEIIRTRVVVLNGDVCQADLGLDAAQARQAAHALQLVVHAASDIRLNLSMEESRRSIREGTKHVLAFARACPKFERLGFVSSAEVAGDYAGVVYEEFLTGYRQGFLNAYERAKFEAEEYLRGEMASGVPLTVFRVGMVVGEAATGKALGFQSFYLLLEKLLLAPDFPVLPRGCPVDVIPVDILADAMRVLMECPLARGRVYHLSQGLQGRWSFDEFLRKARPLAQERLGVALPRCRYLPPLLVRAALGCLSLFFWGRARRRLRNRLVFLRLLDAKWRLDNRMARRDLARHGVCFPPLESYLPRLLDYYFEHRGEARFPI